MGQWSCSFIFPLVPMVFKGRTFGKFITKTRIASFKNVRTRWYQYPLRVGSFLLVMYVIPWLFYRILIPWLDRRSAAAAGLASSALWFPAFTFSIYFLPPLWPSFINGFFMKKYPALTLSVPLQNCKHVPARSKNAALHFPKSQEIQRRRSFHYSSSNPSPASFNR